MKRKTSPKSVSKDATMAAKQPGYTDFAKRAYAPVSGLNEMFLGNVERVAKFQYELAGDLMNLALEQMRATVKAKDLPTLVAQQRELATKFAETAQERQQSFAKLAADSQAGLATWIEEATAAVSGKAA
jgi:phasin family protein